MPIRVRLVGPAVVLLALAGVLLPGQSSAIAPHRASAPSGWAQTNADAAHSRDNPGEHVLTTATISQVRFLRSVTAPPTSPEDPCFNDPFVAPVLVGGALYSVVDGVLTKINAATGQVVWRTNPDPQRITFYTSLSVAGGLVVVGGGDCISQSDPNGFLQAFRATNGSRAWSVAVGAGFGESVVSHGYVVFEGETAASGTQVTVRRLAGGAPVWSHHYDNTCFLQGNLVVVHALVVHQACTATGKVVLGGDRLTTGKRVWTRWRNWRPVAGDRDTTAGTHLFVLDPAGTVRELDAGTGHTGYTPDGASHILAVGPVRFFATCGTDGDVCGYDLASGAQDWDVSAFFSGTLAATAGGVLYLGDGSVLRSTTGAAIRFLWAGNATSLAVGNGRIATVTDPRVLDVYGLPGS